MLATPKNFQLALKKLNTEQRKAVETIEGPVMVLAGPGTGKTQVVALRIAQILSQTQMGPNNILALTFTEAGVTALRDRLIKLIGPTAYRVTISTFHGFSNEVIGIFPHLFTQTQTLRLISDAERFLLIEEILNNEQSLKVLRPLRKPDLYVYEISQRIKTAKQENVSPDELKKIIKQSAGKKPTESEKQRLEEFVKIYQQYNSQLSERGWYDYEDTIVFVVDALKTNEEVRAYFQERYQYMLVDEYQDTNNSQNALVGVLADFYQNPNLFVVGDDKQAIYRFQGASVANMLHFKQRYPEMVVINLKQNYRSSPEILAVAKELISHNRYQINKLVKGQDNEVVANLPSADPVTLFESTSSVGQLAQIIQLVETYQKTGTALPQIAVLWRKRENVKQFAQFAQKNNLPISGQVLLELFDEPAVRSLLNLLSAIAKPTNNLLVIAALRPILSDSDLLELYKINRSIRSTTPIVEKLLTASKSLRQTAQQLLEVHKLSDTLTVQETIEWLMDETRHFQKRLSLDTLAGAELLLSFYNLAAGYADQKDATLISFLEYTQMVRSRNLDVPIAKLLPENGLFIGTVHSAKGLEFERVILAGVDEKNWSLKSKPELIKLPSEIVGLTDWQDDNEEDERRLFYVGLTRAKKSLSLTMSKLTSDQKTVLPSQFVIELGDINHKNTVSDEKTSKLTIKRLLQKTPAQILSDQQLDYIRSIIASSPLSYSDIRAYQTCPSQYYFSRVLRLPQPPSEPLMYGNVVHRALEMLMREYRSYKKLPPKKRLIELATEATSQLVSPQWQKRIIDHAIAVLDRYYDAKLPIWRVPAGIEYSFTHHHVYYGDMWITGKFDRIDLIDPVTKAVTIVDYKTKSRSISRNEIEGKTQSSDGEIKRQLVFYAMLAKHDPLFPFIAKQFQISIVDDKGEFKDEVFSVTNEEIADLEKLVIAMRQEMLALKYFKHTNADYNNGCEVCRIYS